VDVSRDPAALAEMVSKSRQRGVPVVTVDDQVVVGFDRPRLEKLLSQTRAQRPSLGISIADASRMAMKAGALPVFGALVGKVAPSSPGERAGLKPGDIITEANLRPINNAADLEKVLEGLAPGSRLALTVTRGNQKQGLNVVV
jgi:S1-C subfamily serine protease